MNVTKSSIPPGHNPSPSSFQQLMMQQILPHRVISNQPHNLDGNHAFPKPRFPFISFYLIYLHLVATKSPSGRSWWRRGVLRPSMAWRGATRTSSRANTYKKTRVGGTARNTPMLKLRYGG